MKPLLIEPGIGVVLDYDALLERLKADRSFAPLCCASRTGEIIVELVKALASGRRLTLVDAQLTPFERSHLGLDGPPVSPAEALPPVLSGNPAALIQRCASSHGFELELVTSGSTGLPKRVVHRLSSLTRTLRTGPRHIADVWALCYNPAHIAGVQVILQAFFNANPIVSIVGAAPGVAWHTLRVQAVTHLSATPTFYRLLLAEATEPNPVVRHVTVGGEVLDQPLLARLHAAFPAARVRNHYASTEGGTLLVSDGDVFSIPAELSGRVKVEDGTLRVHASMLGKFEGEKLTEPRGGDGREGEKLKAETLKAETECGGAGKAPTEARPGAGVESFSAFSVSAFSAQWYDTGDLVQIVANDPLRVRFVGRDRDWVNVGGEKINPTEIEAELRSHPAVDDAQVYGRANSVVGQILCARIVARGSVDETALRDFLASRLHSVKVPRLFALVSSIQRSRTGKAAR